MGNNSSRSDITKSFTHSENQWENSTPRHIQHKVLPEKKNDTKLRATNNGEILHNGGTLSKKSNLIIANGRKNMEICRSNSVSSHSTEKYNKVSKHNLFLSYHEDDIIESRKDGKSLSSVFSNEFNNSSHIQMRQDSGKFNKSNSHTIAAMDVLVIRDSNKYKNKKKYKAPSPPTNSELEKVNSVDHRRDLTDKSVIRRSRLFKTQAELKTKKSSPLLINDECTNTRSNYQDKKFKKINKTTSVHLQRTRSMPDLQFELNKTKENLKKKVEPKITSKPPINNFKIRPYDNNSYLETKKNKTSDRNMINGSRGSTVYENNWNEKEMNGNNNKLQRTFSSPSANETSKVSTNKNSAPKKTFYFGMEETNENFLPSISIPFSKCRKLKHSLSDSSHSDSSNELIAKDEIKDEIALHLRPILPKKQLEIPRFSPSSAWKMLSTIETQAGSTTSISGEDNLLLAEEKITKRSRYPPPPPPPVILGCSRSNNDKSGDSGISGDAGPPEVEEGRNEPSTLPFILTESQSQLTSWTPQQDLQEESSEEDNISTISTKIIFEPTKSTSTNLHSSRNVFSLSLPRDNRFANYIDNSKECNSNTNTSLQRLKNSVVGVLNNFNKKDSNENSYLQNKNSNWFLSKSDPNFLNNKGFRSLDFQNIRPEVDDIKLINAQQNIGRVMYLPEKKYQSRRYSHDDEKIETSYRRKSTNLDKMKMYSLSKSHENISSKLINDKTQNYNSHSGEKPINKFKRFTFQSTIRQIERKRLAEKLSKEAEIKEKQRLSEFEAMQKVEREFQIKREREKANIKQKLRIFSFEEANSFNSLPYESNFMNDFTVRSDRDGEIVLSLSDKSSPNANKPFLIKNKCSEILLEKKNSINKIENTSSKFDDSDDNLIKAHATEVLSEFRQMKREYRDFRSSHYLNDVNDNTFIKPTTVYPQITYNMPKAFGYQYS